MNHRSSLLTSSIVITNSRFSHHLSFSDELVAFRVEPFRRIRPSNLQKEEVMEPISSNDKRCTTCSVFLNNSTCSWISRADPIFGDAISLWEYGETIIMFF